MSPFKNLGIADVIWERDNRTLEINNIDHDITPLGFSVYMDLKIQTSLTFQFVNTESFF